MTMIIYRGLVAIIFLFFAEATFTHKCHDCTDESCDALIPIDLTGKCETKVHGKCFIRQDPNGLTYRGCADQGHWPDLDYSYVGCRLQRYGAWDHKKVLWCFCDFDLCNTNVTSVREFYRNRKGVPSRTSQQNVNKPTNQGGNSNVGHQNPGNQNAQRTNVQGRITGTGSVGYNKQEQQNRENIQNQHNIQGSGHQFVQQGQGYNKQSLQKQPQTNRNLQAPNGNKNIQQVKSNQQNQGGKSISPGKLRYTKPTSQKSSGHSIGSAKQTSVPRTGSKFQYYFKKPNYPKHQSQGSQYTKQSSQNQQKSVKSMQTKQKLPPIVIVPLDPPKQTNTYKPQHTDHSKSFHQYQKHPVDNRPNQGAAAYNGQQQMGDFANNGQQTGSLSQHGHVDATGQYYGHQSGHQGQGSQTGQGSQMGQSQVLSGSNGKAFWNNVITALLTGEGKDTQHNREGGTAPNNQGNQVSCPGGQVWTGCGGCDLTCAGVQPCLAVCVPKCQCPQKYPVLHNGQCVAAEQCHKQGGAVSIGQVDGGTFVYPNGDIQPGDFGIGITIDTDLFGRHHAAKQSGDVINTGGQHQNARNQPPVNIACSSNQVWTSCGSPCLATCDNYLTLTCIRSCSRGCHCPSDLPIWHNGECISFETCPAGPISRPAAGCPGTQVWTEQGKACTATCQDPSPPCPRHYVARCQCPHHIPIFHDGVCMTANQCPGKQPVCPSNQVYMECGSACMATCENFRGLVCTLQCKAGCHCPLAIPIWHNNLCVHASKCPSKVNIGTQTRQGQRHSLNQGHGQSAGASGQAGVQGQDHRGLGIHGHGLSGQVGVQGHGISGQGTAQGQGGQVGIHGQGAGIHGQGTGIHGQGTGIHGQGTGIHGQGGIGIHGQGGVGIHGQGVGIHGQGGVGIHRQGGAGIHGQGGVGIHGQGGVGIHGQGGGAQGHGISGHSRIGIGIGVEKQGPDTESINEVDSGISIISTDTKYTKGGCYSGACHHICSVQKNNPVCSCRNGYIIQEDGKTCKDYDECSVNKAGCSQLCTNTEGSYHCSCKAGYRLQKDGLTCTDVNECLRSNGGCSHTCENTEGTYQCTCPQGYKLTSDLHSCTDLVECVSGTVRCQQACENTEGSYRCTCSEGYTLSQDGWTCDDLNECNAQSHGCEHYCMNERGTYRCMCMTGYELSADGRSCTDVDECVILSGGGCSYQCTNTQGSYMCACPEGYRLDQEGRTCTDVDECQNNNGGCMHICENSQGTASCLCQNGYILAADGRSCTSLNTCSDNNGGCSQLCESLPSGTRCGCRDGYKLDRDDKTCIDVDECFIKNGGCTQLCINTQGSYSCACTRGYRTDVGRKLCLDVNECLNQNGGCADGCENLLGSFRCTCPFGYTVAPDGFQCRDVNECLSQNGGCADLCLNTEGSFECACQGQLLQLSPDGRNCEARCPDGFIKSDVINSCYRVFQESSQVKNMTDAMATCQSLHPLASLVAIESQQERLFLSSILANSPVMLEGWQGWWTSGAYRPTISQFQWGTGSELENDSLLWGFMKTPYVDTCVWILQMPVYDYTLGNFDCKTESGFICEIKVPNRSLAT